MGFDALGNHNVEHELDERLELEAPGSRRLAQLEPLLEQPAPLAAAPCYGLPPPGKATTSNADCHPTNWYDWVIRV